MLLSVGAIAVTSSASDWPTVDCGALLDDASSPRGAALTDIKAAVESRGFFYCGNVDTILDAEYIESIYEYSRKAHSLSEATKRQHARPHGGYVGPDVGVSANVHEPGKLPSVRSWDYSRTPNHFVAAEAESSSRGKYPPVDVLAPQFEAVLSELFDRQQWLGVALLEAFAEVLGLDRDAFSRHIGDEVGTIRLLHYPQVAESPSFSVGIGAHTDFEVFTLMHQSAPGLQLRSASISLHSVNASSAVVTATAAGTAAGTAQVAMEWEDAPVRPGQFVVILGDVLERMTNGAWKATPHRVPLRPGAPERYAIIRFQALSGSASVAPLPDFVTQTRPKAYSAVSMGEHLKVTIDNLLRSGD